MTEIPRLSASIGHKLTTESALSAWANHRLLGNCPKESSATQEEGRLWHHALLEDSHDVSVLEFDAFRSNEAKAAKAATIAEGKIPVARPKFELLARNAPQIRDALREYGIDLEGVSEQRFEWMEKADSGRDVACSGYIDNFQGPRIVELKTGSSPTSIRDAQRQIANSHALLQDAAYRGALSAYTDLDPERMEVVFAFVQTRPPFSVTPVTLAGDFRELSYLRWRRAINMWDECISKGTDRKFWPGPVSAITPISAPGWMISQEMELEALDGERKFEDHAAKRERVPMLVGLIGPSGSGKTYSALRLATGMRKATGGEIFFVDTESRRALHYADEFDFRHVPMDAPFSPADYLEAIRYCESKKAGILIVDSMSHEHEGPGGVLEMHDRYLDEKAGNDWNKRNKLTMSAWIKPKAERRRLINEVLRMGVNAIFCFRAKPKIKLVSGRDPVHLGWQPIAGEEFVFEMTINCLLYPNGGGVPVWQPDEKAEGVMIKRPEKLISVFRDGKPLSEETGEGLAKWAAGDASKAPPVMSSELAGAIGKIDSVEDRAELDVLMNDLAGLEWDTDEKAAIKAAIMSKRLDVGE